MNNNGNTLKYRVGQVELNMKEIDVKMDKILTNHLPHIQLEIANLSTKVKMFTALNVGAITVAIIIQYIFR